MIKNTLRVATRPSNPALSDEKKMTEAALQSLRDFRLARVANRQFPSQPEIKVA